jgi:hypothetical protein
VIWACKFPSVRPDALHQHIFADEGPGRLDQYHQHIECAVAELDWLVVAKQLASMHEQLITTECYARR